ncbi:MAG: polysaccharide deacetylase family protein, partial [Gammaproteobacteria bacterium]
PHPGDHYEKINVDNLNALMRRVFGYLLRHSYSAWATWPAGTKFAGFISEDTEDKFVQAKSVLSIVRQKEFPITWFMLSNLALEHRDLTRELAAVGEVACHGDSHLAFSLNTLQDQTIRLARCQKVLKELTGEIPIGFRPPEERLNGDTIDALLNVGMDYLFADNDADIAVPKIVATKVPNASLVSLPRKAEDDYSLWEVGKLDFQRSVAVVDRDMAAMERVGGLYGFSFHSQYMDDADNLRVVVHVGEKLREREAYFSTAKRIAAWWRLRDALIRGKKVDEILFDYFEPVQLTVTAEGELVRAEHLANSEGNNANSAVITDHALKGEGS